MIPHPWVLFALVGFISACAVGPKLSGKTFLAKRLSREYWRLKKIPTLALDPWLDRDWGAQAWVTRDEKKFFAAVWSTENHLIIIDEAAMTIKRSEDLVPLFTALRHHKHRLLVLAHGTRDLLPEMRSNLDTLFLFRQGKKAANRWLEDFPNEAIIQCTQLDKHEFLEVTSYGAVRRRSLTDE